MRKLKQAQWSRVDRAYVGVERGKRYLLPVERKSAVFEGRPMYVVFGMRVTVLQSRHRKPHHPLSHNLQKHEVEVCREKEMPQAEASLRNSIDRRKVLAPNRLVSIGILPHVNSIKRNLDVSSALSPHSRITRLTNNQIKSDKELNSQNGRESDDKNAVALVKSVHHNWVVYHKIHGCTRFSKRQTVPGKPDAKSLGIDSISTVHSRLRHASIREKKGPSLGKIQVKKSSSAKSQRNAI